MSTVDPRVYSREYFLSEAYGGAEAFLRNETDKRFYEDFEEAEIKENMKVLDIGCGKGEMVCLCASRGVDAVGIDYSEDAIKLAETKKNSLPGKTKERARFRRIEGFKYPFEGNLFDRVLMLDVAEHLSDEELRECFTEAKRLLKDC